jgi:hypothetical protein
LSPFRATCPDSIFLFEKFSFWDILPCIPLKISGVSEKHISIFRVETRNQNETGRKQVACCVLRSGFLLGSLFELEDGGDISPERRCRSSYYTVLYRRS